MVSKMFLDSWTRLVFLSSSRTWSYSDVEAIKRMLVTDSKHWNHFCLCVLWPPTSTKRKGTLKTKNKLSTHARNLLNLHLTRWCQSCTLSPPWWSSWRRGCPAGWGRTRSWPPGPGCPGSTGPSLSADTRYAGQTPSGSPCLTTAGAASTEMRSETWMVMAWPLVHTLNWGNVVLLRLAVLSNNNNWSPNNSLSLLLRGIFSFFCASTNTFMPLNRTFLGT